MKKLLQGVMQFPVDAQSSGFVCAFTSVMLAADGVTDGTPVYCGRNRRACVHCNACGEKTMMERHHLAAYHDHVTTSGLGLLWHDQGATGGFEAPFREGVFVEGLPDRLGFLFRAAGYAYTRLAKADGEETVFARIKDSIDGGMPVLLKLGGGDDWSVVTGYDVEGRVLYGIDAYKHWAVNPAVQPNGYTDDGLFYTSNWFKNLTCAIVIMGQTDKLAFPSLIRRMLTALDRPENASLEADVLAALDRADGDKQALAAWLNDLAGYTVECRWHAAECATAKIYHMTESRRAKELLGGITDRYLQFHDLCWRVWALLGVGPESNYQLASDVSERLTRQEVIGELKQLFTRLFGIDREVCAMLREILEA